MSVGSAGDVSDMPAGGSSVAKFGDELSDELSDELLDELNAEQSGCCRLRQARDKSATAQTR